MKKLLVILPILAIAWSAGASPALEKYINDLESIRLYLADDQAEAARIQARGLIGKWIDDFHADDALLKSIADAKQIDVRTISRLDSTIAALRAESGAPATKADLKVLAAIEHEQQIAKRRAGGEVIDTNKNIDDRMESISKLMMKALRWIGDKIGEFLDWLSKFWPETSIKAPGATPNMRAIVIAVAILIAIVIAILAWEALRKSRKRDKEVVESQTPIESARDADPLSRGANEWELYAVKLAAAGRTREAIRAWYHAVLVTLYAAAILHFRKGRTNWEYVATLSPSLAWRRDFIELTRTFEREWYGADEGSIDALERSSALAKEILDEVHRASRGAA